MNLSKYIVLMAWPLAFIGCDKVEVPIEPEVVVPIDTSDTTDTINPLPEDEVYKKILVEEFTGHQCTWCPLNTAQLLELQEKHKDQVIVVAYHVDFFAQVDPQKYPTDFTTNYGTKFFEDALQKGNGDIPFALVNRDSFGDPDPFFSQHVNWKVPIENSLNTLTNVKIKMNALYNNSNNSFDVDLSVNSPEDLNGSNHLVILCVEDSIIAPQKDGRLDVNMYPGQRDTNYIHRHVLRGQLNSDHGLYGQQIGNNPESGVIHSETYNFPVPSKVLDPFNCSIVAFLLSFDEKTTVHKIIQAEEVHVH